MLLLQLPADLDLTVEAHGTGQGILEVLHDSTQQQYNLKK